MARIFRKQAHFGETRQSFFQKLPMDLGLLFGTLALVFVGVMIVYDASVVHSFRDYGDNYVYVRQQLIWVVLGVIGMIAASVFPYQNYKILGQWMFLVALVLLLAVLIPGLGVGAGGAHRWLDLGFVTIQPAEIIKLASVVYLAALFEKKTEIKPFVLLVGGVTFVIGVLQKDMGSAAVYFLTCFLLFIISGAKLKYIWYLLPGGLAAFLFLILTSPYRQRRMLGFLDPFSDPQGYTYHIGQVLIAIGSGGLFGLGLGQSKQKFEFIPEVSTDSIFAIVGEEFGFFGAVLMISLFAFLIYRGFVIAGGVNNRYGSLLAYGIVFWLAVQTLVNLGAMVSVIPLTGVPLPFVSYGGSALLSNMLAIGILLNISKNRPV
jgi:cell division protein FtsW